MLKPVIIGVGFNIQPEALSTMEYLDQIVRKLEQAPLKIIHKAGIYKTRALGAPGQPDYTNSVLLAETFLSPLALLRVLKVCERSFGRKGAKIPWSAREIDLDIIDFKGIILGSQKKQQKKHQKFAARGSLYLPHIHAHMRSFVLGPLMETLPHWKHPILRQSVKTLLRNAQRREKNGPGSIINAEN